MTGKSAVSSRSAASTGSKLVSSKSVQPPDRSFCTPARFGIIVIFWVAIGLVVVTAGWILVQKEAETTTYVPDTDEPVRNRSTSNETSPTVTATISTPRPPCNTGDCQKVVDLYTDSLSRTKLPCDNFYDYVCEGFSAGHADTTVQGLASRQVMEFVVESLLTADAKEPAYRTASNFFTSCTKSRARGDDNKAVLAEFFAAAKLDDATFQPVDKWVELMFVYGIPVAIELTLAEDGYAEKDEAKYNFEMVESEEYRLWQTQLDSVSDRDEYIEEVLRAADANLTDFPVAGVKAAEDSVVAMWRQQPSGQPSDEKRKMSLLFASDPLQSTWVTALQNHTQDVLPGEFRVKGGELYGFFQDFMSTDESELRLYVAWEATRQLFAIAGVNTTANDSDTLARCYDLTVQRLRYAFVSPYLFSAVSDNVIQAVRNMTEIIRAKGLEVIRGSSLNRTHLEDAVHKLSRMQVMYGYPEGLQTVDDLNRHYSSFEAEEDEVFSRTYLNVSRQFMSSLLKTAGTDPVVLNRTGIKAHVPMTYYVYGTNMVKIPTASMLAPWYFGGAPAAVNYGSLGRTVVNEMMRTFDLFGRNYDADGFLSLTTETEWRKNTDDHYRKTLDCIFNVPEGGKLPNSVFEQSESLLLTLGLNALYEAYKSVAAPFETLQGLDNVTSDQLFYISYCYSTCEGKNARRSNLLALPETSCNLPLENSVHFAAAFKCPLKSRMNSCRKCNFWSNIEGMTLYSCS